MLADEDGWTFGVQPSCAVDEPRCRLGELNSMRDCSRASDGVATHVSQSSLDGVGVYVSAECRSASRSFAFPHAFESGAVELLGE